jgi:hypothetical protein
MPSALGIAFFHKHWGAYEANPLIESDPIWLQAFCNGCGPPVSLSVSGVFDPAIRFVQFRGTFHSFDPVGFAIFANRPPNT